MIEPIVSSPDTRYGYCTMCEEPTRVGALQLKGWKHTALVCASCLRSLATSIDLSNRPGATIGAPVRVADHNGD